MLRTGLPELRRLLLEMIALNEMGDGELSCLFSCPKLQNFTWSTYGGAYAISVEAAKEWVKRCPDLAYVGAYRMRKEVKEFLRREGIRTR